MILAKKEHKMDKTNKKSNTHQRCEIFRKGILHLAHKPWFIVIVVLAGILLLLLFMYFSARTNIVGQVGSYESGGGVVEDVDLGSEEQSPSGSDESSTSSNILGYSLAGLAAVGGGLAAYLRWRRIKKEEQGNEQKSSHRRSLHHSRKKSHVKRL